MECYDESSGYPYYYNAGSGEYRWDRPAEMAVVGDNTLEDALPLGGTEDSVLALTSRSTRLRAAPIWTEYADDESGGIYYVHSETGEPPTPPKFYVFWLDLLKSNILATMFVVTARFSKVARTKFNRFVVCARAGEAQWD